MKVLKQNPHSVDKNTGTNNGASFIKKALKSMAILATCVVAWMFIVGVFIYSLNGQIASKLDAITTFGVFFGCFTWILLMVESEG